METVFSLKQHTIHSVLQDGSIGGFWALAGALGCACLNCWKTFFEAFKTDLIAVEYTYGGHARKVSTNNAVPPPPPLQETQQLCSTEEVPLCLCEALSQPNTTPPPPPPACMNPDSYARPKKCLWAPRGVRYGSAKACNVFANHSCPSNAVKWPPLHHTNHCLKCLGCRALGLYCIMRGTNLGVTLRFHHVVW